MRYIICFLIFISCSSNHNKRIATAEAEFESNSHEYDIHYMTLKLEDDVETSYFKGVKNSKGEVFYIFTNSDLQYSIRSNENNKHAVFMTDDYIKGRRVLFYAYIDHKNSPFSRMPLPIQKYTVMKAGRQGCIPHLIMDGRSSEFVKPLQVRMHGKSYFPAFMAYHSSKREHKYTCAFVEYNDNNKGLVDDFLKMANPYKVYVGFDDCERIDDIYIVNKYTLYRELKI